MTTHHDDSPIRLSRFAQSALQASQLLTPFGFAVRRTTEQCVRLESSKVFVEFWYAPQQCELALYVGLVNGDHPSSTEQRFALQTVAAALHDQVPQEIREFTPGSESEIPELVHEMASWLAKYCVPALKNDPGIFESIRQQQNSDALAVTECFEAERLRIAADDAWRRKGYLEASAAYRAIRDTLRTERLTMSEIKRLDYCERNLR